LVIEMYMFDEGRRDVYHCGSITVLIVVGESAHQFLYMISLLL
jgi:hypothetical protein